MNLKLLANQVFLRSKCERSNERPMNADEKERSFPKMRMNAEMNAKNTEPVPFHTDSRELDPDAVDNINGTFDPPDPATHRTIAAAMWLEDTLSQPRRIGEIFAQWGGGEQRLQRNGSLRWEGGQDGENGHWGTDLCKARELLGIEAFVGADGLMWWTCPETAAQAQERMNVA
jgi:hypothetical protein